MTSPCLTLNGLPAADVSLSTYSLTAWGKC